MAKVIVAGGGLAGMAAAVALSGEGHKVALFESRAMLGGRATSYTLTGADGSEETIDNCQHILLGCCTNLLDFYRRLGVSGCIRFHREYFFLEPGGRVSVLKTGRLPVPLVMAWSFSRLAFLDLGEKLAIARALLAVRREYGSRQDLDRITMLAWLEEKNQPAGAISNFWRPVLISAVNAELDQMAAKHGVQVFRLAFLGGPDAVQMGVPSVPLGELYGPKTLERLGIEVQFRSPLTRIRFDGKSITGMEFAGGAHRADYYVCALPFDQIGLVAPELELDISAFRYSTITGIHLWFDRPITDLPQAALLGRTIQWIFVKTGGQYVQLVVSASSALLSMNKNQIVELALNELAEFIPNVRAAKLQKAHVIKEIRATFLPQPGLEALRPANRTGFGNLFLAGDWTRSGWPATMEGAVRSGYLAAEAITEAAGTPQAFLQHDAI